MLLILILSLLAASLRNPKYPSHFEREMKSSVNKQPYVNPKIKTVSVNDKEDVLRKLKLLCHYEDEPHMANLEEITNKWKQAAWDALRELISSFKEEMTEEEVLRKLGIDPVTISLQSENV
ncbi:unnamed protein product [Heterobilharzia americana]|nr:unnamed protein product [Heterobilharzia americana]